jgi:hypothetical protein
MRKWKFFYKHDPEEEQYTVIVASDKEEATRMASELKQLSIEIFDKLFIVEEII